MDKMNKNIIHESQKHSIEQNKPEEKIIYRMIPFIQRRKTKLINCVEIKITVSFECEGGGRD